MGLTDLQLQHAAFDLWLTADGEDNLVDLERLKRVMPKILKECCTEKQRKYILDYYVNRLSTVEIAERDGINISTVSRHINRGLNRAYSYLRFVSPLFMDVPRRQGNINNGSNRRANLRKRRTGDET